MGTNIPRVKAQAGERVDHLITRAMKAGAKLQAECIRFFDADGDLFIDENEAKLINASSWAKNGENISLFTQLKNGKVLKNTYTPEMDEYTTKLRYDGKRVIFQDIADDKEHSYTYYNFSVYDMYYSTNGKKRIEKEHGCTDVTKDVQIKTKNGYVIQGYDEKGMVFSKEVIIKPNKITCNLKYGDKCYNDFQESRSHYIGQGPKELDE